MRRGSVEVLRLPMQSMKAHVPAHPPLRDRHLMKYWGARGARRRLSSVEDAATDFDMRDDYDRVRERPLPIFRPTFCILPVAFRLPLLSTHRVSEKDQGLHGSVWRKRHQCDH